MNLLSGDVLTSVVILVPASLQKMRVVLKKKWTTPSLQRLTHQTYCMRPRTLLVPLLGNDNHPIILGSIEDMVRLRRLCETNHSGAPTLRWPDMEPMKPSVFV